MVADRLPLVSYTHLTLPKNREEEIYDVDVYTSNKTDEEDSVHSIIQYNIQKTKKY